MVMLIIFPVTATIIVIIVLGRPYLRIIGGGF